MLEPAQKLDPQQATKQIVALISESEWREAAIVMRVLRPILKTEQFVMLREQLLSEGYCLLGIRADDRIVSIASYTISPHAILGRELLIHDMATLPEARGRGCATALISELVRIATQQGCGRLFVHTRNAQTLYTHGGFEEYSTGMIKRLDG